MKIQISNVRKNGYLSARELNEDGSLIQRNRNLCCVFPEAFSGAVLPGSIWRVSGSVVENRINLRGQTFVEDLMVCESVELEHISTLLLQAWLSKNINRVGPQKAKRFANYPGFICLAQEGDPAGLLRVPTMTLEMAGEIVRKFPRDEQVETINWFSKHAIPVKIAYRLSPMASHGERRH